MDWQQGQARIDAALAEWRQRWPAYSPHALAGDAPDGLAEALEDYLARLSANPPFFHPAWMAQMQMPPHPAALLGYHAALRINPNGYMPGGGAPTLEMEREAVQALAAMLHLPATATGHLTSGGSSANLEALWAARSARPDAGVAFSRHAHLSHRRACALLAVAPHPIDVDARGRMDLDHLEHLLRRERIGTVVATAGTTALGAVDPIEQLLPLRERYGFHLHVDAAWGGFFALLAWAGDHRIPAAPLRAIAAADTVVIDPHKRGLQPIGCGCLLYADPRRTLPLQGDSPYADWDADTYSPGRYSLECSRPGAAAGALWLTLRCLPLEAATGLGQWLSPGLDAAREWADALAENDRLALYCAPDLDLVAFAPAAALHSAAALDAASGDLCRRAATAASPLWLGQVRLETADLLRRFPRLMPDQPQAGLVRAVLMKPEHQGGAEAAVRQLAGLAPAVR